MSKIVVVENLSLDGVMEAPGRCDEDVRGGLEQGGWALPYNDAVKVQVLGRGMAEAGPLLFGRATYKDFFKIFPNRTDNPFSEVLDNTQKYVASRTLTEPLPWKNSTLLEGDATDAVARLKTQPVQETRAAGVWVFDGGLHPPSTATVVRVQRNEVLIADGPYAEGKEHIGGFLIIKVPDLDSALEWARKVARALTLDGAEVDAGLPIEVRPFQGEVAS